MGDAGARLIIAANEAAKRGKDNLDVCMLHSMASSLRLGLGFSFNQEDMADLLERAAATIAMSDKEPKA